MTTRPSSLRRATVSVLLTAMLIAACSSEKPEALLASAKDYLAKNDAKAAVIQIKNALQANPNQPEARYLLGKALFESGDPAAAEVELRKAIDQKYSTEQVTPLLAKALLAQGQVKKLSDELTQVKLSSSESQADLQTSIAIAEFAQGKTDAAQSALTAALAAQPDYAPALLVQARLKAASKDLSGAMQIIDAVLAKSPNNHEALKFKGDVLAAQGNSEAALAAYRKALEARPDYLLAHTAAVATLIQQGKLDDAIRQFEAMKKLAPKNPQTLYLEAQLAYQKKDFKGARELAQQLLKATPNNPNGLQFAGAVEFQLKSLLQAEDYLSRALQIAPEMPLARRLLVLIYLRTGQASKAMNTLQPVLGKIDQDANMLALAGEVFVQNNEPQKAEDYFGKAAALDPKDAKKRTSLALAHMIKGNVDGAFSELEEIASSDSGTTADLALITTHLRRNEPEKALKAIEGLEKKQPDNPMVYNLRGRTLLAKKDVAGARKSFEKALSVSPVYFPAAASLATLDLADNKPDDARKRFEGVLAADAKNMQALIALAELRARTGGTADEVIALVGKAVSANPAEPAPRLLLVDLYLRSKDVKKALSAAQDAVTALPDRPEVLDALGRTQQATGDFNQAITTYNKLAGMQPKSPQPYLRLAEVHLAANNKDAAIQSLRKGLEIKPDLVEAQRGLIMLDLDAGKSQEAVEVAREVQKQRPKEAVGFILEGDVGVARKSWSDAATAYRSGLKQAPTAELALKLHSVLLAGGNGAEAGKFEGTWLKDHPKDIVFRIYLGDSASKRKDYDKAASYYQAALDIQPNNAVALNNLAWVTGLQKGAKAIEYAERANKLAPNQPPFMDTLAMLLAEKGDTGRALELLKKAVELAPQAAVIRLNYARVLIKSGNKADGRKELEELAKLGDKFPAQGEVTQLLKTL